MLYVLLGIVVALALVCGVQAATISNLKMKHRAEMSELKCANFTMEKKLQAIMDRVSKLSGVWEGIER